MLKTYPCGNIYKIFDINNPEQFYIGSTFQTLANRLCGHKVMCLKQPNMKLYAYVNQLPNKWTDVKIELIELIKTNITKPELLKKEGEYQRLLKPPLNKYTAGAFTEVGRKQYDKQYNVDHKEDIQQYKKQYYEDHKQEIKERMQKQMKQYNEQHKEHINCNCGGTYVEYNKSIHFKTKKHKKYLESLQTQQNQQQTN